MCGFINACYRRYRDKLRETGAFEQPKFDLNAGKQAMETTNTGNFRLPSGNLSTARPAT